MYKKIEQNGAMRTNHIKPKIDNAVKLMSVDFVLIHIISKCCKLTQEEQKTR